MPLYEYECQACQHHVEAQQKMADAPLKTCPSCGKDTLQRLISATAFHLKGGGWYKDLYSSTKPGAESSSPSPTPTPAASDAKAASPAPSPSPSPTSGGGGSSST